MSWRCSMAENTRLFNLRTKVSQMQSRNAEAFEESNYSESYHEYLADIKSEERKLKRLHIIEEYENIRKKTEEEPELNFITTTPVQEPEPDFAFLSKSEPIKFIEPENIKSRFRSGSGKYPSLDLDECVNSFFIWKYADTIKKIKSTPPFDIDFTDVSPLRYSNLKAIFINSILDFYKPDNKTITIRIKRYKKRGIKYRHYISTKIPLKIKADFNDIFQNDTNYLGFDHNLNDIFLRRLPFCLWIDKFFDFFMNEQEHSPNYIEFNINNGNLDSISMITKYSDTIIKRNISPKIFNRIEKILFYANIR